MRYETEDSVKTRPVEDSVRHAMEATSRLEAILEGLMGDITGGGPLGNDASVPPATGLLYTADRLAGRLESLTGLAQSIRERVVTSRVVSPAQFAYATTGAGQSLNRANTGNY